MKRSLKPYACEKQAEKAYKAPCLRGRRPVPSEAVFNGLRGVHLKRIFDILLAFSGLIVSAPVWFVIALAIGIEDGWPILIVQERSGKGRRLFMCLKFRSMAESTHNTVKDVQDDPRVTKVGWVLRKTALDELPQLLNIIKGDMSFVGPKPLYPIVEDGEGGFYRRIDEIPGFADRSLVAPGLTGIAQIFAPRDISRRHKFRYDILYIKNQSFWLDLKLIALSFWITFRGKWESRGKKF